VSPLPRGAISVRLAMSLDGYIADHDGGYDWIVPVPSPRLNTAHRLPFDAFLEPCLEFCDDVVSVVTAAFLRRLNPGPGVPAADVPRRSPFPN
jgi:hypothetical protein